MKSGAEQPINNFETPPPLTVEEVLVLMKENQRTRIDEGKDIEKRKEIVLGLLEKLLAERERFKHVFKTDKGSTYFILETGESLRIKKQQPSKWQDEYEVQPLVKHIFFISPEEWSRIFEVIKNGWQYSSRDWRERAEVIPDEEEALERRKKVYEDLIKDSPDHDEEDTARFRFVDYERRGLSRLIGEPIMTTEVAPGTTPIEFDFVEGGGRETLYSLEGDILILKGHKTKIREENNTERDRIWPEQIGVSHYGHPVTEILK